MPKITPFLWFQQDGEEAIAFYLSVFKDAKVNGSTRFGDEVPGPKGKVMTATLEIGGQKLMIFNGGPAAGFEFSPAISLFVSCETQEEIDELWEKLTAGGKELQCGWLTDKYGVTWQIVPAVLGKLMGDPDPATAKRVTAAMMKMIKLDIAGLERARDQK